MFSLLNTLSESKLVPSQSTLTHYDAHELADLLVLYICAIYVLHHYDDTKGVARRYAKRTIMFGEDYDRWRMSANDLYAILYGLLAHGVNLKNPKSSDQFRKSLPLGLSSLNRWIKAMSTDTMNNSTHRALFSRLDNNFKISNSTIRSIRRSVMDWDQLDNNDRRLIMTRLLQLLRLRAPKSELLPELHRLADEHRLEIDGLKSNAVSDYLSPGANEKKGGSLLVALAGVAAGVAAAKAIARKDESASSGGTGAASIAASPTAVGGIGVGFDPNGDKGVYQGAKKKKPLILRR